LRPKTKPGEPMINADPRPPLQPHPAPLRPRRQRGRTVTSP
jgi:hypothetical protein